MTEPITWSEVEVDINTLKPYPNNPRYISKEEFEKLLNAIMNDGYSSRIKVTKDMVIIGGHQRKQALKQLGYSTIPVLMASRELTALEFQRILLEDNKVNGEWDMDVLANTFDDNLIVEFKSDLPGLSSIFSDDDDEPVKQKREVRCPCCDAVFPIKGNKA